MFDANGYIYEKVLIPCPSDDPNDPLVILNVDQIDCRIGTGRDDI